MRKVINENLPRTMMEVFRSLPEGTLAELIDNQLYMSPAPTTNHQTVSKNIFRKLMEIVEDTSRALCSMLHWMYTWMNNGMSFNRT